MTAEASIITATTANPLSFWKPITDITPMKKTAAAYTAPAKPKGLLKGRAIESNRVVTSQ